MNIIAFIGFLAGGLNILAVLPQIIKILKKHHTKDISLPTYIVLNIATFLWIVYGVLIHQAPVFVINAIYLLLNFTILVLKIKYG